MRYADSHCTYTERYKPEHVYVYTGNDIFTGKEVTVRIPAAALNAYRRGAMIQNAMPMLTPEERDFLLSGMYESFPEE